MRPNEARFFYHSFPRRRAGEDGNAKGAAILESICERGIALTPERIEWREVIGGAQLGPPTYLHQIRTSFTELAPSELPGHAGVFGPFALEFEDTELRRLGALPVMYLPQASVPVGGLDGVGATAIARLVEARDVMNALTALADTVADPSEVDPLRFRPPGFHDPVPLDRMTRRGARMLIDALFKGRQRPEAIAGALDGVGDLFYPTERAPNGDARLRYYRQREWRLTSDVVRAGRVVDRPANAADRAALSAIDAPFFGEEIAWIGNDRLPRSVLCRFLRDVEGRALMRHVRRIIAPQSACDQAKHVLAQAGFTHIVVASLESLPAR